jgi:paraquat-inducible protein B
MSDTPTSTIPKAIIKAPSKRKLPLVWIVPMVAAIIGIWLVVQNIVNEGPTVTIRFTNAEGIEPGKTKIKYKDVDIGEVSNVAVSKDRKQIILTAKLVKEARDYLLKDTRFWVVRPRISAGTVSGLNTLLSGAYIGVDIGKSDETVHDFVGLEVPPIVTGDLPGRQYILHSAEIGSLDVGAVVTFRRLNVGQVVAYSLDPDGKAITLKVFINAPYDQYVTDNTRFWHSSGIDLSVDANGLKLETQSLGSIIQGGLAFQTPPDSIPGAPAAKDATFKLYHDRELAMRLPDKTIIPYTVYFNDSLRGLTPGAPVDFHGIVVGEVKSINVEYLPKEGVFHFPVEINIYPDRMSSRYIAGAKQPVGDTDAENRGLADKLVAAGMRAQLKTGNLLTGQLYVSLDFYPKSPKATIDWKHVPAVLPSINGGLGEIQDSLASILAKVDKIPFDQLSGELVTSLKTLNKTLDNTDQLITKINNDVAPEIKATLTDARGTLNAAQQVLNSEAPLQLDLREALRQVSKSAQAVGSLADYLDRHPESLIRGKPTPKPLHSDEGKAP